MPAEDNGRDYGDGGDDDEGYESYIEEEEYVVEEDGTSTPQVHGNIMAQVGGP